MLLPNPKEAIHKMWLYRLLTAILDNQILASYLYFKGGTCAAMLKRLDRFSIDLDFDYVGEKKNLDETVNNLEMVFNKLGLEIKRESEKAPQYSLKYPAKANSRNTIKINVTFSPPKANEYQSYRLTEIDRVAKCQTVETMFANKLVALIDRWEKQGSIAGRDLYDIHYFFAQGFNYDEKIIIERRGHDLVYFLKELINFIENNITQTIINQDLNPLLPLDKFKKLRDTLKQEVLMFLRDEVGRAA